MKTASLIAGLVVILALPAGAQEPIKTKRKDVSGNKVNVTLTGRYADCLRDGVRLGYSQDAARRYCDSRNLKK